MVELSARLGVHDLRDAKARMMPRVLMFLPQFLPIVGGTERQVDLLTATLLKQGVETEVLTFRREPGWPAVETRLGNAVIHRVGYVDLNRRFPRIKNAGLGLVSVVCNFIPIM